LRIEEKYLFCKTPKIKGLLSMKLGKIGQEIYEMKSSLYYFPYWFPGIITQITVDKK
jgi:hypothetical protein